MNQIPATRVKRATLLVVLLAFSSLSSFFLSVLIAASERSFHDYLGSRPLPALTQLCIDYRIAVMLVPLPWAAAAVFLIVRRNSSPFSLTAFSSTLIIALLTAAIIVIAALAFPWLPMRIGMSPK